MQLVTRGLLFSHIPKTAGTSFRVATKRSAWGWKIYSDYERDSKTTSPIIRSIYAGEDISLITRIDTRRTMLAGHFPIRKYIKYYPAHRVISFVRDPVQRILSHYHDTQRRLGYTGTLEEFINEPRFCNLQSQYFDGIPVEAVGAVGISEFYNESLDLFRALYNLGTPVRRLNDNKQKKEKFYLVSGELSGLIRRQNQADCALYEKALRLFLLRRTLMRKGLPYIYGKLEPGQGNTIRGWAVDPLVDAPVSLDIVRNGRIERRVVADEPVPALAAINIARSGNVGFSCTLDWQPGADDNLEVRVAATGQVLSV